MSPASVADKSGVGASLRADSGVRSPVPATTRSREISHVDYSPEGRVRANLLLADGARPASSSPATAVFRQSSDRAVSPLKPPVDVSVAGPDVAAATDAAPADGFGGVGAAIEREGSRCRDVRALRRVASRVSGSG